MRFEFFVLVFLGSLFFMDITSAAHFITGHVNDALDSETANDKTVMLWNPVYGMGDNLTDIVGVNGNSHRDNKYMIDCELLDNGCSVGDILSLKVIDSGDGYFSESVNVTVTGAGFNVAPNMTLNSLPQFSGVVFDDSLASPENEIDLFAASVRETYCKAYVEELDGDDIVSANARIFHESSLYSEGDDNNYHYTNSSCYINDSYGGVTESEIVCRFEMQYYSDAGNWECVLEVQDNLSATSNSSDIAGVNELLSIQVNDSVDFGEVALSGVSSERVLNVTNTGNVVVNLSLSGYGLTEGDGLAMTCSAGDNISIGYEKYNLTDSTPVVADLGEFENTYENLTSSPVAREFSLGYRKNDTLSGVDDINATYWRIYVPSGVGGSCSGNIIFGAVQAAGT